MDTPLPGPRRSAIELRRILVPVDLSANSVQALHYAMELAEQVNAAVIVLHIAQLNIAGEKRGVPRDRVPNEWDEATRRKLHKLIDELGTQAAVTQVVIGTGRPHEEIVEQAREADVGLIILAERRHTGWRRIFGSHTKSRVLRYAPCPVLVLPEAETDAPDYILF